MPVPDFSPGEVLTAAAMDSIGLWLVSTTTVGTGVSSVVVNNCFSANYVNYRIVWNGIVHTSGANLQIQLSGITGNSYLTGGSFTSYGSATLTGFGPAATTSWVVGSAGAVNSLGSIDVMAPFLTTAKGFGGFGTGTTAQYTFNGACTSTSSATGFTLSVNAGTVTGGTIRVYGYRN